VENRILEISRLVKDRFLTTQRDPNEFSLFLCGGKGGEEESLRRILRKRISNLISKYRYRIYFPEDMFVELTLGHQRHDLLSLENILAKSVDCVVILLQSPGTFTELGAFANHRRLRDKLIIVTDPKYARDKSFINLGPIRYLKRQSKSKILFCKINVRNLKNLVKYITDAVREIAKSSSSPPVVDLTNPIATYEFYLALVYVFDPISLKRTLDIVDNLSDVKQRTTVNTVAQSVINILINEQKITCGAGLLSTSEKGIDSLIYSNRTKKNTKIILSSLTGLRVRALNSTLRKDYYRKWVG
jgi:hypothetical protein